MPNAAQVTPPRRSLLADGLQTLVTRLGGVTITALLGVVTARVLGPQQRGIYALPLIDAALVTTVFSGLSLATSYFLLHGRAPRSVLAAGLRAAALLVACGAIVVSAMALLEHHIWAILPAIAVLPPAAAAAIASGYYVGTHRVPRSNTLALITSALTLILITFGLLAIRPQAMVAITMWIVASAVAGFGALGLTFGEVRANDQPHVPFREYFGFAMRIGAINFVSMLNYRIDVYIVAVMTDPASLGIYVIAVSGAEALQLVTQIAATITTPRIGSLSDDASARFTARAIRNTIVFAVAPCLLLAAFAGRLVPLLFGARFAPAVTPLRIILIGVFALAPGGLLSSFFTIKLGKPRLPLMLAAASALLCAVVSVLLVPRLGITGAALATAISYVSGVGAFLIYFSKYSGLPLSTILVPQAEDIALYRQLVRDASARLWRTSPIQKPMP